MTGEATIRSDNETAVMLLNEDGCIVDAHASCLQTFGWQREELIGKDIKEVLQYGRELLMNQLQLLEGDESAGNTSFAIRLLARKKNQEQFPVRATVRRFNELACWTVAFYRAESEMGDSNVIPALSPQEISLAKRAMEESRGRGKVEKPKAKISAQKGEGMSVTKLWRNSRLLFSTREEKQAVTEQVETEKALDNRDSADAVQALRESAEELPETELADTPPPTPVASPKASTSPEPAPIIESKSVIAPVVQPQVPPQENMNRIDAQKPSPESVATVARLKAELEKERSERIRIEQRAASLSSQVQNLHLQISESLTVEREGGERMQKLETQLSEVEANATHYKAAWEKEGMERLSVEEQLEVTSQLNARLQENLNLMEKSRQQLGSRQNELQEQLSRNQKLLKESELALGKESEVRQRLELSLASSLRESRELEQKTVLERAQLQASLENAELQSRRTEEEVLRVRAESLSASRESRSRLTKLQESLGATLQSLNVLSTDLLQIALSEEQKHSLEAIIQELMRVEAGLANETLPARLHVAEELPRQLEVA